MKIGFRYGFLLFVILAVFGPGVSGAESNPRALSLLRAAQNLEKLGNKKGALEFYAMTVKRYHLSQEGQSAIVRIRVLGGKVPTADEFEDSPAVDAGPAEFKRHQQRVEHLNGDNRVPAPSNPPNLARIRFQGGTGVPRQGGVKVKKRLGLGFELGYGFTSMDQFVAFASGGGTVLPDGSIVRPVDHKAMGPPLPVRTFDGSPDMVNYGSRPVVMPTWYWDPNRGWVKRNVVLRSPWRVK